MPRGRPKKVKIPLKNDDTQELLNRIEECEIVVNELDDSMVWKIVQKDLFFQKQMLDDNWQEIQEGEKLQKARELKFATLHILRLKDKYQEELESKRKELALYQNIKEEIPKDYDMESKTE